jgi:hypothetical protein
MKRIYFFTIPQRQTPNRSTIFYHYFLKCCMTTSRFSFSRFAASVSGFLLASVVCTSVQNVYAQQIVPQSLQHLKSTQKQHHVSKLQFHATRGEGVGCEGLGICRATSQNSNDDLSKTVRSERSFTAEGRFNVQQGQLNFVLTNIDCKEMSIADIPSFPFDFDTELPREAARNLGFSGVKVYKSRYVALTQGVFPVHAKFSVGLATQTLPASYNTKGTSHRVGVTFEILQAMDVQVIITNADGEHVASLMNTTRLDGSENVQTLLWNGADTNGQPVRAGLYNVEVRCRVVNGGLSFGESVQVFLSPTLAMK